MFKKNYLSMFWTHVTSYKIRDDAKTASEVRESKKVYDKEKR